MNKTIGVDSSLDRVSNFCIGAQRAATTYLYELLAAHSNAQLSPLKEVHFFDSYLVGSLNFYHSCFPGLANAVDITPSYSANRDRLNRIFTYNQKAKILLIERNPVDRIVSHYLYYRDRYSDAGSFESFLTNNRDDCVGRCAYDAIASAVNNLFGPEQCMRLRYEELTQNPNRSINAVISFFRLHRLTDSLPESTRRAVNNNSQMRSSSIFRTLRLVYRRLPVVVPYSWKARVFNGLDTAYSRMTWLHSADDPQDANDMKQLAAQYLAGVRLDDFWN